MLVSNKFKREYTLDNGRQLIRRFDLGEGRWEAQSDKSKQVYYLVTMNAEQQDCTCNDFKFRGLGDYSCKHMKRVMEVS